MIKCFAKILINIDEYSSSEQLSTLNNILIKFLNVLELAPTNLFEHILDFNYILPMDNLVICNVRIETIAMDYFHLNLKRRDNTHENDGKLNVWKSFLRELKQYIKESLNDETSEETMEQIFQCIYWPLTCSISEIEVFLAC